MLLDKMTKAYIVCYCDTSSGGNSKCTKCKETGIQKNCSFFSKLPNSDSCSNLRFDEYCSSYIASDFASGKDIHIEDITNPPIIKNYPVPKMYVDTPKGIREIRNNSRSKVMIPIIKKVREEKKLEFLDDDEYDFEEDFEDEMEDAQIAALKGSHEFTITPAGKKILRDGNRKLLQYFEEEEQFEDYEGVHPEVLNKIPYTVRPKVLKQIPYTSSNEVINRHEESHKIVTDQMLKDAYAGDMSELMWEYEEWEHDQKDHLIIGAKSIDDHRTYHDICHSEFWKDKDGNRPEAFTTITREDVSNGIWTPVDGGPDPFERISKGNNLMNECYSPLGPASAKDLNALGPFISDSIFKHAKENAGDPCIGKFLIDTQQDFIDPQPGFNVPIDNSASITKEQFDRLALIVSSELKNQMSNRSASIEKVVKVRYLREMLESFCCAFDAKHEFSLDMSHVNIYTIYKSDGHFISLRDLYRDGIYPMDLDFRMINGSTDLQEYGFEPFLEMVPKMLNYGR